MVSDNKRVLISVVACASYVMGISIYIAIFRSVEFTTCKLLYNYLSLSAVLFLGLEFKFGIKTFLQGAIDEILFFAVCINYALIIIHYHSFSKVDDYIVKFYTFDGAVLLTSVFIFISAWQNGLFKNEN